MRLPKALIDDCAARGGKWQDRLRELLDEARSTRFELQAVERHLESRCLMVEADTMEYLEAQARRLTKETGQTWTVGAVVRAIWEARSG